MVRRCVRCVYRCVGYVKEVCRVCVEMCRIGEGGVLDVCRDVSDM